MKATVKLTLGVRHRCLRGHPWIFDNEVRSIEGSYEPGDIVEVRDARDNVVGSGYINPRSSILVRLLAREGENVDENLIFQRLKKAIEYRMAVFGHGEPLGRSPEGYRLVFSEADFLPGLIVDMFAGYIVFQTLTLGIDLWKETIIKGLNELVEPKGIYERNDAPVRELEGLNLETGFMGESFDPLVEIYENDIKVVVDIQRGQKTGYFLDQSSNRLSIRNLCKGKRVLDAFSYSGGFGLSAAAGGAREVVCLDVSDAALDLARVSAQCNGFTQMKFMKDNVFNVLRQCEQERDMFDLVILDPPAFARSRRMVPKALSGYKDINLRAMKIINNGGYLATSSCSQHLASHEFDSMVDESASDSRKYLRLVLSRGARQDHPVLVGVPETEYLKFRTFQVIDR